MTRTAMLAISFAFFLSSSLFSQEPVMKPTPVQSAAVSSDIKALVVYYSKSGHTERVAKDIAAALGADVEKLIDKKNRNGFFAWFGGGRDAMRKQLTQIEPQKYDPSKYSLVIVGTPIWAGNMTPAVRTWLEANKAALPKVAYFCTAGGDKIEKLLPSFEAVTGKKPVAYVGFVGKDLKDSKKYKEKLAAFEGRVGAR